MTDGAFVAALVKAAGGRLVGRVRLQKIAYLLQQVGLEEVRDLEWSYHHYGPYSEKLDEQLIFAKLFNLIDEKRRPRSSDGALYSIFELGQGAKKKVPELPENGRHLVQRLRDEDSIILELAATAHWLSEKEQIADWREELHRRKTWKVEDGRLEKALELLKDLGLPPVAEAQAATTR
ncbi:MAG: hypothetical protein D6694_04575 [Gammaproteobacteria bacterium]|nr:MAG: hypothetical protein D6694_04575 [Gammaproteobacteria bacterium]